MNHSMIDNSTIKAKVLRLLKTHPELRDNDYRLAANIWKGEFNYKDSSAEEMLKLFASGLLTHPETIRRIRQKLQETIPELRGERYAARLVKEQAERQAVLNWKTIK